MGEAKRIIVKPISAKDANRVVRELHYSGKVDTRSQLHYGVFIDEKCCGAIQLGPPIDKRKVIGTVSGTLWHEMLDLHRLAFSERLPRNSESRAISVVMRMIRLGYPQIKWVQSYADATQCGDGAIYRASGFDLIGIKPNTSMFRMPTGEVCCKIIFEPGFSPNASGSASAKSRFGKTGSETANRFLDRIGAKKLVGFQLRYIYFIDASCRDRLTVPVLPFSEIERRGAGMYKGQRRDRSAAGGTPGIQPGGGGSIPTRSLHSPPEDSADV